MMMEREETRHKEEERQRDEIFNPLLFEHQLETDMKNDPYGSKTQEHCKLSFKEMSEMVAKNADGTYNQQAFKRILEQFLKIDFFDLSPGLLMEFDVTLDVNLKKLNYLSDFSWEEVGNPTLVIGKRLQDLTAMRSTQMRSALRKLEREELEKMTSFLKMEPATAFYPDFSLMNEIERVVTSKGLNLEEIIQKLNSDPGKIDDLQKDAYLNSIGYALKKFNTTEKLNVGQEILDESIPEWMKKKPSDLEKLILDKAKGDFITLKKLMDATKKKVTKIWDQEYKLESFDKAFLREIKVALGRSACPTKSKNELIKSIKSLLRMKDLDLDVIINNLKGSVSSQPINVVNKKDSVPPSTSQGTSIKANFVQDQNEGNDSFDNEAAIKSVTLGLAKLSTPEIFRVGEECFDQSLSEDLKKNSKALKTLILERAQLNESTLKKLQELTEKKLKDIKETKDKLESCETPELIDIGLGLNIPLDNTKTKEVLTKDIRFHMRKHALDCTIICNILEGVKPMDIDMDLPSCSGFLSHNQNDENGITKDGNPFELGPALEALHNEQVRKIAQSMEIKLSERLKKRPKDLKEKIISMTKDGQEVMKLCKSLCIDFQEKNLQVESVSKFHHAELHELSKYLGMECSVHTNTTQLCKQVKNHLIVKDCSLTQTLEKMQKEPLLLNVDVSRMIKCVNPDQPKELEQPKQVVEQKLMIENKLAKEKHLRSCLEKDLDLLNDKTFFDVARYLSRIMILKDLTKEALLNDVVGSNFKLKILATFIDYHFFMNCSNYNMLSEMDLDGLKEVANEVNITYLPFYGHKGLMYHLMEHFKNNCFNDFIQLIKIVNRGFNFTSQDYLAEFESRMKEAPEWIKLKEPQKFNESSNSTTTANKYLDQFLIPLKEKRSLCLMNLTQQWKLMHQLSSSEPSLSFAMSTQQRKMLDFLEWDNSEIFDYKKHLENYDSSWKETTKSFVRENQEEIISSLTDQEFQSAIKEFCQQDVSERFWNVAKLERMSKKDVMNLMGDESVVENHLCLVFWIIVIEHVRAINVKITQIEKNKIFLKNVEEANKRDPFPLRIVRKK